MCGGNLVVSSARGKRANRYLVCWRHRSRKGACPNGWNVPLQPLTDAIVSHFTKDVLTAESIAQVARDLAADADSSPERVGEALKAELGQIDKRVTQAVEAFIAARALRRSMRPCGRGSPSSTRRRPASPSGPRRASRSAWGSS